MVTLELATSLKQIFLSYQSQAIQILTQLLRNGRKERSVYSVLAFCYFQTGDFQNASLCYSELIKICPEITEYSYYLAQCLLKSGMYEEALEVCEKQLDNTHLQQKGKQLKAAIYYEKNEFDMAKKHLKSLNTSDFASLVNEGCIYFKQDQIEKALGKFNDAIKICGFNAELFYNVALSYYELHEYKESVTFLDVILQKAYEKFPQLKNVTEENPVFEKDKTISTQILRESAIVEALNLKAAILYFQEDYEGAKQVIKKVPVIQEGGTDPVTFHNQAVLFVNQNSAESIKKLNYLLNNSLFPPETFQNLLFLYCKYFFFDLANELIQENPKFCESLLEKDDFDYIQTMILQQQDPNGAIKHFQTILDYYKGQIQQSNQEIEKLQEEYMEGRIENSSEIEQQVRYLDQRLRIMKEKYAAVLTSQAKIFWDMKDYKSVQQVFTDSQDICDGFQIFNVNLAHSIYMQEGKQSEAILYYEKIVEESQDNLLKCETIVLANLCVCYILTKQNSKAENLIQKIQLHEQNVLANDPSAQLFHSCIVNLVIGTLYCSRGHFEFGFSLIFRSLEPAKDKLGTDTWYYTKRCLLALIEKIIKKSIELSDQFFNQIISFLDEAYTVGKNITTVNKFAYKLNYYS
ncbi:tpr domain containing protein [Stylonychia lemnae]|uniref:Tpr domain containing protein n=1 Tax=Stylonychia lemnae TaxID=5949 RepID=A0A078ACM7_STYLE|nr:tpr domain containing protein [Stylonychia lemnae]|eukprot:CDW79337.1 tpr domain containing protein [Stylonychia lemnae]